MPLFTLYLKDIRNQGIIAGKEFMPEYIHHVSVSVYLLYKALTFSSEGAMRNSMPGISISPETFHPIALRESIFTSGAITMTSLTSVNEGNNLMYGIWCGETQF